VLPNIAHFTLEELPSAFIHITYESREKRQKAIQKE
jgi:hypothetical protein